MNIKHQSNKWGLVYLVLTGSVLWNEGISASQVKLELESESDRLIGSSSAKEDSKCTAELKQKLDWIFEKSVWGTKVSTRYAPKIVREKNIFAHA